MVKINIGNKRYKLPKGLTVAQWKELMQWDFTQPSHWPKIIEIAVGIPEEDTKYADEEALELFVALLINVLNERVRVDIPDFNELLFGEFVDLDVFISLGIDKHIDSMLEVLKVDVKTSGEALYIIEQFNMWRISIFRQYKKLFGLNDKDFEKFAAEQEDDLDPMSTARGWYKIIVELAKDDILKLDKITEQPLKKVFNFMAIQKEKKLAEQEAIRKQKQQTKQR